MSTSIFFGKAPANVLKWIVEHSAHEDPDPVDTSMWGQVVAALEDCRPSEFNMANLTYTGSNSILTAFAVGSTKPIAYDITGSGSTVNAQFMNLGFNGSIPEYVKYRRAVSGGYIHCWVKSTGADGMLKEIAVGDATYGRTYDSTAKANTYADASAPIEAIGGSTFTYGNNCTYSVPTLITAGGKDYAFCGYNITLNSRETLAQQAFDPNASCFLAGTKITMADGSKKNVEELTYDDVVKVWDFDEGKFSTAPICWLTKPGLTNDHYYKLTFSDGSVLRTTGKNSNHKVYNVDERFFKGVDKTKVGDRIYSENGIVTVTSKEYVKEEVPYYNLITSLKINCVADGILTSDRYGNMYPIDETMKYVKEGRVIRPYSEFEAAGIDRYWYDNLRLGEVDETIETTKDYIYKCESQMLPRTIDGKTIPAEPTKEMN